MDASDTLRDLQVWYQRQCDGDWEHEFGVSIDTLDNPGWTIRIDLARTSVFARDYTRSEIHRDDGNWVVSWRDDERWHGACGAANLDEALQSFLVWATAA